MLSIDTPQSQYWLKNAVKLFSTQVEHMIGLYDNADYEDLTILMPLVELPLDGVVRSFQIVGIRLNGFDLTVELQCHDLGSTLYTVNI